jgi:hypothetical protein
MRARGAFVEPAPWASLGPVADASAVGGSTGRGAQGDDVSLAVAAASVLRSVAVTVRPPRLTAHPALGTPAAAVVTSATSGADAALGTSARARRICARRARPPFVRRRWGPVRHRRRGQPPRARAALPSPPPPLAARPSLWARPCAPRWWPAPIGRARRRRSDGLAGATAGTTTKAGHLVPPPRTPLLRQRRHQCPSPPLASASLQLALQHSVLPGGHHGCHGCLGCCLRCRVQSLPYCGRCHHLRHRRCHRRC